MWKANMVSSSQMLNEGGKIFRMMKEKMLDIQGTELGTT